MRKNNILLFPSIIIFLYIIKVFISVMIIFLLLQNCTSIADKNEKKDIYNGYYLIQGVGTYNSSQFGFISTVSEAKQIMSILVNAKVSGVEFESGWYDSHDIQTHIEIAKIANSYGIDIWLTSWNYQAKIPAFNNGVFPIQFRAYKMTSDGFIIPATAWANGRVEECPAFDVLDPEAVNWYIEQYKKQYLEKMEPYMSGFFFNEDNLGFVSNNIEPNTYTIPPKYWELPVYSDAVLLQWKEYCLVNNIIYNGEIVDKFPVHSISMVENGLGKTSYFPGYNIPSKVAVNTLISSIPVNTGVWAEWDDFITSLYIQNYIGELSKAVYEVNHANSNFKGVIYFGLYKWSLAYEEVTNNKYKVESIYENIPWGKQRGIVLNKICKLPYVDYIICETYPPIKEDKLYIYASEYKSIIENNDKVFGLMVHRDDNWSLDIKDSEDDRWKMINYFKPVIIARFSINHLLPDNPLHNPIKEQEFIINLEEYRTQ